jgi:putative transposase
MNLNSDIVLTYKYRVLPTKQQHTKLADILESQRILYNSALQERIDCYRKTGNSIRLYDQQRSVTQIRSEITGWDHPVRLHRWTLVRLHEAYEAFFRRITSNGKAGFPRYRSKARWRSFGFSEWNGIHLEGNRLHFKGLPGSLRIHVHRPLPEGKPLACTFTRDHKGWSVSLQYRVPAAMLPSTGKEIGIDMHQAAEVELARVWTKIDVIRAKQAAKPRGSALPMSPSYGASEGAL